LQQSENGNHNMHVFKCINRNVKLSELNGTSQSLIQYFIFSSGDVNGP